jgi:hypothetical protein
MCLILHCFIWIPWCGVDYSFIWIPLEDLYYSVLRFGLCVNLFCVCAPIVFCCCLFSVSFVLVELLTRIGVVMPKWLTRIETLIFHDECAVPSNFYALSNKMQWYKVCYMFFRFMSGIWNSIPTSSSQVIWDNISCYIVFCLLVVVIPAAKLVVPGRVPW